MLIRVSVAILGDSTGEAGDWAGTWACLSVNLNHVFEKQTNFCPSDIFLRLFLTKWEGQLRFKTAEVLMQKLFPKFLIQPTVKYSAWNCLGMRKNIAPAGLM